MKRFIKMFKPRFAPLVEQFIKTQTMRPRPKRMPKVGDIIDCREWTGKPYRSKQRKLCEGRITAVRECWVDRGSVVLGLANELEQLRGEALETFAKADGFTSSEEMAAWFGAEHGLPFEGILIQWEGGAK